MRLQPNFLRYFPTLRMLRALALSTLLFSATLLSQRQQQQTSSQVTLPQVTADSLDRTKVTLPADFSKPLNLLVLSFVRDQQEAVETWIQTVQQLRSPHAQVQLWVLPISAHEDILYKWWLNSSMRDNLAKNQSPRYTVPLYVNKRQFRKVLAISSEKQIVVLLTDKAGVVLWRSEGAATRERQASLAGALVASPPAR